MLFKKFMKTRVLASVIFGSGALGKALRIFTVILMAKGINYTTAVKMAGVLCHILVYLFPLPHYLPPVNAELLRGFCPITCKWINVPCSNVLS